MVDGTPGAVSSRVLSGIALMVGAVCVFSALDTTAKYLVVYLPTPVVVLFRYAFAALIVAGVVWQAGGRDLLASTHLRLHVLRAALLLACTALNFLAVNYLRLDQTSALMFSTPLFVCALSVPLLGERVGPHRWLAVVVGFLGVLVIVRPGTDGFHWAMLASLGVALCGALYQIATRHVGRNDHALTSLFYVSAAGTVFAMPLTGLGWQMPEGWQWLALAAMGGLGSLGHLLLIEAHRRAPAPVLAPYVYVQIIPMSVLGYLVFGNTPDAWTLVGAAIIVASGLYVFYREHRINRAIASDIQEIP
jgi:drug/metabolite transporter (DMT)-like permease